MSISCSNTECKIAETGKCIEGFDVLEECPTYNKEDEELWFDANGENDEQIEHIEHTEQIEQSISYSIKSELIQLPTGMTLSDAETDCFLKKYSSKVVACIGPSNIGKTTLIASFYELLNMGPIGCYQFGGSKTLFAFEEVCHHARAISKNSVAKTPRTIRKDTAFFFHIALSNIPNNRRIDLLLSERAGEEYEAAMDHTDNCLNLFEVKRSDVLMILINGEAISDNVRRHAEITRVINLARALQESEVIYPTTKILLVTTRYDLVVKLDACEKVRERCESILNRINSLFPNHQTNLHMIAARPEDAELTKVGFGIRELLEEILEVSQRNYVPQIVKECQSTRILHKLRAES